MRRLIILKSTSFHYTLCTFDDKNEIHPLARSRVSLRNLPIGSPKTFKFPLLNPHNESESVILRCVATLSSFTPQTYIQPAQQRSMTVIGGQQLGITPQYMGNHAFGQPYFRK